MNYLEASIDDLDQIIKMRLEFITHNQGTIKTKDIKAMKKQLPGYFTENIGKSIFIFVAKDNEKIVSIAMLNIITKPSNPHFINGKVGEALNVYTKEKYRRQGIASKLITMLLEFSKTKNLDYVELESTNNGCGLYKKMGFKDSKSDYTHMKYQL